MSHAVPVPPGAPAEVPSAEVFTKALVTLMRAHDTYGVWTGKNDDALLDSYVISREQRKKTPVIGDPDPRTLWRLDVFYTAVGFALTRSTGVDVTSLLKVSGEGFGRVVLFAGRLVVLDRPLRDVHRFGFDSIDALALAGASLVDQGARLLGRFPDVARMTA